MRPRLATPTTAKQTRPVLRIRLPRKALSPRTRRAPAASARSSREARRGPLAGSAYPVFLSSSARGFDYRRETLKFSARSHYNVGVE